jgi:TfoX/Sxy family transcriptional regulator of competence genes
MAYDEVLAERVRDVIGEADGLTTRKMFGGIAYMIFGNMACGVLDEVIVLRLGNEGAREALEEPYMSPMDFTGKPMKSMVYLDESGYEDDEVMERWIEQAVGFARSLPQK